jgi:hypothetical protein
VALTYALPLLLFARTVTTARKALRPKLLFAMPRV